MRIYALMSCTPDLSPGNCDACLRANVRSYQECCRANIGGATRRPSCYVRWDLYPFLGAFDNIRDGPSPTKKLKKGIHQNPRMNVTLLLAKFVNFNCFKIFISILIVFAIRFFFIKSKHESLND